MARAALRLALATGSLAVGAAAAGLWTVSGMVMHPPWHVHRTPQEGLLPHDGDAWALEVWQGVHHDPGVDFGYAFEDVEFPAVDGSQLRGWYVPGAPEARAGVVTVHGGGADRREFLRHLPIFHEAGYPTLLFDCREHGTSDGNGRGISLGVREHADVRAAVDYLVDVRGLERIAVIGTSQGGASVILAAAEDARIDAVISENPFTSIRELVRDTTAGTGGAPPALLEWVGALAAWRLGGDDPAPIDAVGRIAPRPLLLMHGTADRVIPPEHSRRLLARSGRPSELWLAPGAGHATLFNRYPDEYRDRVQGFLARSIGAPGA